MTTDKNILQASDEPMLPCPFCGTQPYCMPISGGVYCNNDACAIVGEVFSGGPRHWNRRDTPSATADVQRDAARYRFLRDSVANTSPWTPHGTVWVVRYNHPTGQIPVMESAGKGNALDANVDAAIAATKL